MAYDFTYCHSQGYLQQINYSKLMKIQIKLNLVCLIKQIVLHSCYISYFPPKQLLHSKLLLISRLKFKL